MALDMGDINKLLGQGASSGQATALQLAATQQVAAALLNSVARQAIIAAAADAVSRLDCGRGGVDLAALLTVNQQAQTNSDPGGGIGDPVVPPNPPIPDPWP